MTHKENAMSETPRFTPDRRYFCDVAISGSWWTVCRCGESFYGKDEGMAKAQWKYHQHADRCPAVRAWKRLTAGDPETP